MTPELYALIHDTSGPTKRIRQLIAMLKDGNKSPEEILDFIEQSVNDIDDAVDSFYLKQNPPTSQGLRPV